jgi:hypothetical protein
MKFIGFLEGRFALQFPWEEVRPLRGSTITSTFNALMAKYNFKYPPNMERPWGEIENAVMEFREGFVFLGSEMQEVNALRIYSDGLQAQCATTDLAEKVVDELIAWGRDTLGYREFVRLPRKIYSSEIVVMFERPIEGLFAKWRALQTLLDQPIRDHYSDIAQKVDAFRVVWRCDPTTTPRANLLSEIVIERRANEPFTENRFYCSAPLPTSEFIALLEKLENLL